MGRPLWDVPELTNRIEKLTGRSGFTKLDKWNGEVAGWGDDAILLDLDPAHASRVWLPLSCCRLDGEALYVSEWLLRRRERDIGAHQAMAAAMRKGSPP